MPAMMQSQREKLRSLISGQPIVRAQELRNAGIAGSTIQRALDDGDLVRIGRGLIRSAIGQSVSLAPDISRHCRTKRDLKWCRNSLKSRLG